MALFITSRDISMFRHVNKELINDIVQTEVDFFKIKLGDTKSNVYGETSNSKKTYYQPVRLSCLITRDDIINTTDEMGVDTNQTLTFSFLRDGTLSEMNLVPEIGDIIDWDEKYWEVNSLNINQYLSGKNDATNKSIGPEFGANWSYICRTHMTRRDKLKLEKTRFGQ